MYLLPTQNSTVTKEQLRTEIEWELFRMGFHPDLKGFCYIRDAVIMLIDDSAMIYSITKTLYPEVAKKSNTKTTVVERSIRFSIEIAWEKSGEHSLHNYFSHYPDKPTNRTVLAFLYMYINSELNPNRRLFIT